MKNSIWLGILLFTFLTMNITYAEKTINDLLEPNIEDLLKRPPPKGTIKTKIDAPKASTTPPPNNLIFDCPGGNRVEVVAKNSDVHWGLVSNIDVKKTATYTPNVPTGAAKTEVEDHVYYKACSISENSKLIGALKQLACLAKATFVKVNSAYRDPISNALDDGKSMSMHLKCQALDIAMFQGKQGGLKNRIPPETIQSLATTLPNQITGLGKGTSFTHIDVRTQSGGKQIIWTYKNAKTKKAQALDRHHNYTLMELMTPANPM